MRTSAFVVALAAIWVLLWGSASFANVASGLLVGVVIVFTVPGLRQRSGRRPVIRPLAVARLGWYLIWTTIVSNVVLTREVITPGSRIHTAVVGVELPGCSDEILTLITDLLALAPGTMPVELTTDPTVLYVHVLHLEDVEQVEREILRLTDLVVRAFGSADAIAAQDRFHRIRQTSP
jgi:multicomponent Na+:H+ antiporter subunit E